jgi:prepilin-type N-terminal cleavage/methylation domain-containing protein
MKCKHKGFTLIETLIAFALFCIALMPLLSLLSVAYRNEAYSRESYKAQLHAQGIKSVVSEALFTGNDAAMAAADYINGLEDPPQTYGIWLGNTLIAAEGALPFTEVTAYVSGLNGELLTVIVWVEGSAVHGRAFSVI